jgi:hypothetical protein
VVRLASEPYVSIVSENSQRPFEMNRRRDNMFERLKDVLDSLLEGIKKE